MFEFLVKMSVFPPEATIKHHPLCDESEIVFKCKNCTLENAINAILEHTAYKIFCEKNRFFGEQYVYYTDSYGNWHHFNGIA